VTAAVRTREDAVSRARGLARGLPADDAGVRRLLERVTAQDEGDALLAVLLELGARALLEDADAAGGVGRRG
jgi:hypothetical protein